MSAEHGFHSSPSHFSSRSPLHFLLLFPHPHTACLLISGQAVFLLPKPTPSFFFYHFYSLFSFLFLVLTFCLCTISLLTTETGNCVACLSTPDCFLSEKGGFSIKLAAIRKSAALKHSQPSNMFTSMLLLSTRRNNLTSTWRWFIPISAFTVINSSYVLRA